jgi:type I restriction enzyme S subunit
MSFPKYPEYRPSKVQWLADIPAHWSIFSLKRSVDGCVNGIWGNEPTGADDTAVIRVADFERNNLRVGLSKLTYRDISPKEHENRALSSGDLLIEKSGGGEKTLVGCVVLFAHEFTAVTSNFVARMRPLNGFDGCFLCYCFDSLYQGRANYPSIKQTTGIQNLDSEAYLQERFCFPPILEQTQIAAFLDHETAKIDTLIHEQKRLIELLQEKRQAVISHAVTKGLDPKVLMRDSKVEWLGEVPAHWGVSSLKRLVIEPLKYGANEAADDANPDHPRFVRITDVTSDGKLREETYRSLPPDVANPYLLVEGDILLARSGATVGKSFIYQDDWGNCCFAGYLIRARIDQSKAISQFVYSVLQSSNYWQYIGQEQIKATIQNVSAERYGRFFLPVPPLIEQEKILDYLNQRLEEYAGLLDISYTGIKFLKERRSALISAAVTGKIDVRDWQLPADESAFDEEVRQAGMEVTV